MSAIASFYILDTSQLDSLILNAEIIVKKGFFSKKVTDNYWDYLATHATTLKSFNGSGYIYGNLLVYLQEEKNIDLLTSEYDSLVKELTDKRGASHFIFTHHHQQSYLNQLDPSLFSVAAIQKFNQEFSEEGDEATALLTIEAIKALHDNLSEIQNDSQVVLLIVG